MTIFGTGRVRRIGAGLAALAVMGATAVACSPAASTDPGPSTAAEHVRGDELRVGVFNSDTANPALSNKASLIPRLAYQTLLVANDEGSFDGQLAESWEWEDDEHTTMVVTLRDGLEFSDGDVLDADAVVNSYEYFLSASGPDASLYAAITAEAVSDDAVRFTSEQPNPDLPNLFSNDTYAGSIISPTGVANPTLLETESHGIGTYIYDTVEIGGTYTLTANDAYPNQDEINYDTVELVTLMGESNQAAALLADQVDIVFSPMSATWADVVASNPALKLDHGQQAWQGIGLVDRQGDVVPALADVRVRQAMMYAIDREEIAKAIFGPEASSRAQFANPSWLGFDESLEEEFAYDPDKARELLAESDFPDGFTLPVWASAGAPAERFAQAIGGYLSDYGITVEIHSVPHSAAGVALVFDGTVAAGFLPASNTSLTQYLSSFLFETGGMNPHRQVDEGLVEVYETAALSNAEDDWKAVVRYATENALQIPLVHAPNIWVSRTSVDMSDAVSQETGRVDLNAVTPAE